MFFLLKWLKCEWNVFSFLLCKLWIWAGEVLGKQLNIRNCKIILANYLSCFSNQHQASFELGTPPGGPRWEARAWVSARSAWEMHVEGLILGGGPTPPKGDPVLGWVGGTTPRSLKKSPISIFFVALFLGWERVCPPKNQASPKMRPPEPTKQKSRIRFCEILAV